MFFIGENLKHALMTYSFLELFDLLFIKSSIDIYRLELISHHTSKKYWPFGNLGIGVSVLTLASASAFQYKYSFLHSIDSL